MTALAWIVLAAGLCVGGLIGYLAGRYTRAGQAVQAATVDAQAAAIAEVKTDDAIDAKLAADKAETQTMSKQELADALNHDADDRPGGVRQ